VLLGLHGAAGSGKDAVARLLGQEYGFARFAFADFLKDALSSFFGIPRQNFDDPALKEQVDKYWGLSPRQLMQRGGKAWREEFGQDIYIKRMEVLLQAHSLGASSVISDIRMPVEAAFIRAHNGLLIHVVRNSRVPLGALDETERRLSVLDKDLVLNNEGNLSDLERAVDALLKHISAYPQLRVASRI
jgi:hypothetical protein